MNKIIRKFQKALKIKKNNISENYKPKLVVFTGAGISAESRIQTFRDSDGLWENHNVEDVATPMALKNNPDLVYKFYNERRKNVKEAEPNIAHKILAELEEHYNVVIITQNIDDLHERAGSSNVIHLHGYINQQRSIANPEHIYDLKEEDIFDKENRCPKTNARLRPHVVFFGESVPNMSIAKRSLYDADCFMVVGTSLNVYPAADLALYIPKFVKKYLIDPNVSEKVKTHCSDYKFIEDSATVGLSKIKSELIFNVEMIKKSLKNNS